MSFELAKEILGYAKAELERAPQDGRRVPLQKRSRQGLLGPRSGRERVCEGDRGVEPTSHGERRRMLRKMGREGLRALYSDVMKTLHEEAFYEGVYQPDEVEYAIKKVEECVEEMKREVEKGKEK